MNLHSKRMISSMIILSSLLCLVSAWTQQSYSTCTQPVCPCGFRAEGGGVQEKLREIRDRLVVIENQLNGTQGNGIQEYLMQFRDNLDEIENQFLNGKPLNFAAFKPNVFNYY